MTLLRKYQGQLTKLIVTNFEKETFSNPVDFSIQSTTGVLMGNFRVPRGTFSAATLIDKMNSLLRHEFDRPPVTFKVNGGLKFGVTFHQPARVQLCQELAVKVGFAENVVINADKMYKKFIHKRLESALNSCLLVVCLNLCSDHLFVNRYMRILDTFVLPSSPFTGTFIAESSTGNAFICTQNQLSHVEFTFFNEYGFPVNIGDAEIFFQFSFTGI